MANYALHPRLRDVYISRIMDELRTISGAVHERFADELIDRLSPIPLQHRGLNAEGAPVGHTLDSSSSDGHYVAEYSSESGYFTPGRKKIKNDFLHAVKLHPQVQNLWLINNTEAKGKIATQLRNSINRVKHCSGITVEIYDARRTAEFIVDNLLLDSRTPAVLGEFLPSLKTFSAELAATHLVPDPVVNFTERRVEADKVRVRWKTEKVVRLSGISGSGKSALAADIVSKCRQNFHIAVWIDAKDLDRIEDLGSYDVTGGGAAMNVLGLLSERSAIVVLDDVRGSLNIETLRSKCSESSRVIITTQTAVSGSIEIGPLDNRESMNLLCQDISDPCPQSILEKIRANVEGNALALSLLNAYKREQGCSWEELERESEGTDALLDDQHEKLAVRLLDRAQQRIGSELQFLRWCGTQSVDRGFAQYVIGGVGIANLERFNLLTRAGSRSLRLHELVYRAIQRTVGLDQRVSLAIDLKFEEYIGAQAQSKSIALSFALYHHRGRLLSQLSAGNRSGALQYAYFLSTAPGEINVQFAPVPSVIIEQVRSAPGVSSSELAVLALIESMEKEVLNARERGGTTAAAHLLRSQIPTYRALTELGHIPDRLSSVARHHYAKALQRDGQLDESTILFEEILAGPVPLKSSLLQLARIQTSQGLKSEALSGIKSILDFAVENPDGVAATVLLEAVRLLRHPALKPESEQMFRDYGRKIADRIILLASVGFGQAFETFAAVASSWAYSDPTLFDELFESLPPVTTDQPMSDGVRKSWGEVFLAASSSRKDPEQVKEYATKACDLLAPFRASSDDFMRQRLAKAQLQAGDFIGAGETLEMIPEVNRHYWWHYWRGKAYAGLKVYDKAVLELDVAIGTTATPVSSFFATRAEVRAALGDPDCITDLRTALKIGTGNPEYERDLRDELRIMEERFGGRAASTDAAPGE